MTLYEMPEKMLELLDLAESDELSEEDLAEALAELNDNLDHKAEGYVKVMRQISADMETVSDEIARLKEREKTMKNNVDHMKKALIAVMQAMGRPKVKTPLYSISVCKTAPQAVIDVPEDIPEQFWKPQDPKLDKTALKNYLKENGDEPYAHLEAGTSLRIK